jgi:hypothetical protein
MQPLHFALFLLLNTVSLAQPCKVKPDSLQGNYSGNCKNGIANGQGTATGVDSYSGHFKDGYPDGTGRYTWKNGSWYDGEWKKGVYDGKGTLHLIGPDKTNREFSGMWHEGNFLGSESKPYVIYSMSGKISEVSIHRGHESTQGDIIITVYDILNSAPTLDAPNNANGRGALIPKQKLTDIQTKSGTFTNMVTDDQSSHYNNMYKLLGVVYPIHLILTFQTEQVDLEIFEKGKWDVFVKLENMK